MKWTVSNKNLQIVKSTKKYAKVKAVKKGNSVLKAKVSGKTYKCKFTIEQKFDKNLGAKNISYTLKDTGNGVIAILKNNNSFDVNLSAKLVYYSDGKMIDTSRDSNYAFQSGTECALKFSQPYDGNYHAMDYDSYDMTISVEECTNTICASKKIITSTDVGDGKLNTKVTNKSGKKLSYISVAAVFYDDNGKAIGYEDHYADCKENGDSDYITFDFPYDENYNTIEIGSYEIYVNYAYTYTWMK